MTKAGEVEQAYQRFAQILEREPDNLAAHRGLVEAAYYAGRLEEVAKRYRRLADRGERRGLGHYGLALAAVARGPGHMRAALEHFERAAQRMPDEADVPYRIGLMHLMNGRPEDALGHLKLALQKDAERPDVRIALGRCLADLGRGEQAIEAMRPIVGRQLTAEQATKARAVAAEVFDPHRDLPMELAPEVERATDLLQQDAAQPALTIVVDLVGRFPEIAFLHSLKGLVHARLGNNGEAVVAFERALALRPNDPVSLVGLGDVYFRLEKWPRARSYYERAIGLDPFYLEPYQRLGEMALKLGDRDRAVRSFEMLVLFEPDSLVSRHTYARVLFQAGRLDESVGAYQTILERDEQNLAALVSLGRLHLALGQRDPATRERHRDQARDYLERAEEIDPENEAVAQLLASLED